MRPTRVLPLVLVLAVLPAQAVRAQSYLFVKKHVLIERINRDLSGSMQYNPAQYVLETGATHLSYPESTVLPIVVAFAAITIPIIIFLPAVKGVMGVVNTAVLMTPPVVASMPMANIVIATVSLRQWYNATVNNPVRNYLRARQHDFFQDRIEVHYTLEGPDGEIEDGSCLAFFALGENPDGSHDLHYALDACSHDDIFLQAVPMGDGDVRIGPDGVDVWDSLLGQTRVVARGSIPVSH